MNKSQDNITFINLQVGLSSIQVAEHNYNTKNTSHTIIYSGVKVCDS